MSDAKYQKLIDGEPVEPSGCFRRLFRRRQPTAGELASQRARESERKLRRLLQELPAQMEEAHGIVKRNRVAAKRCVRDGNRVKAKVHAKVVLDTERYQERLGAFYANVNQALLLQKNAKIARSIQDALGTASEALERMLESISAEKLVQLMDTLDEQRERMEEVDDELSRDVTQSEAERRLAAMAEEDPEVLSYLDSLMEPQQPEEPVQIPTERQPQKEQTRRKIAVAE
jgi:hypothetical protein